MSAALAAYRALTTLAEPLAPLWLDRRARRGKEERPRLTERLARGDASRPPGHLAWLHGASVGESLSLLPLIDALREADPALGVLVTSGTVTSAELLAKRLPPGVIHRYAPLDLPGAARRFAARWRPDLAVFVESEVWPNLLSAVRREGARTALISARLSQKSLRGWARAPAAARALFGGFDLVMAQEEATAAGLAGLGARDDGRLNLKLAGEAPKFDAEVLSALRRAVEGRPVLLAASTHEGEEEVALAAFGDMGWPPAAHLVIVPRHPERGSAIAAMARQGSWDVGLRSAGDAFGQTAVYVADTLGELGLWYSLAASALIGGSMRPGIGGHNPVEPARLGTPLIRGPHIENWEGVFALIGDAIPVADGSGALAALWDDDLDAPEAARRKAERARSIVEAHLADLPTVASRLTALIGDRP